MYMSKHKASVIIHRVLHNGLDTWHAWESEGLLDMLELWKLEYDDWVQDNQLVTNYHNHV